MSVLNLLLLLIEMVKAGRFRNCSKIRISGIMIFSALWNHYSIKGMFVQQEIFDKILRTLE